ncbi:MAG: ATP-binding protein [Gammaproteobacteria bacterium]|nr:ATP-binding protein [Gammaproteobacteria bacterium]
MGFDKALAEAFARDVDRDRARYFAGRADEIARFDLRLGLLKDQVAAGHTPSSLAMVFQGPPGCGKTSLVDHLGKRHVDVLFVKAEKRHLVTAEKVMERVRQAATATGLLRVGKRTIGLVAEAMGAKELARSASEIIGDAAAERSCVVVHVDEAQTLDAGQEEGLLSLQQGSLDIPVLPVFTGLSHTAASLKAVPGMSRLADGSVVNMTSMLEDECIESTRAMLDSMGAVGSVGENEDTCRYVAKLSRGWPQHLNRAQAALCQELVRTDGQTGSVDRRVVRQRSDEARFSYYRSRLDDPVLAVRPALVAALAGRLERDRPYDLIALTDLCAAQMAKLDIEPKRWFDPKDYVYAMIQRGVLAQNDRDLYTVAIPSMKDWLLRTYGRPDSE